MKPISVPAYNTTKCRHIQGIEYLSILAVRALLEKFQRIALEMYCVAIKAAPGPAKGSISQKGLMSLSLHTNE